jgi:DNA helicase-2/ATP-dependent DNA helicase PcrA
MTDSPLLADLNDAQRDAITHGDGPLLILAAAGSGKTRVITRRVAYLLQQGVSPRNILAITFTNKAAGEMRNRVQALGVSAAVQISTFHTFGARLLREIGADFGLDPAYTIYDQSDRLRMVKLAVEDADLNPERWTPESLMNAISKAKNEMLSPELYEKTKATDFFHKQVAQLYRKYESRMRAANALDFDDLIYWPAMLLKNSEELRKRLDARYRYVLIDEYQDTNAAQYWIARKLCIDFPNLCVVGDPDQSIYKFRGADIRNILDFQKDYPDARVVKLGLNYRSTRNILAAAGSLIVNNRMRVHKDLLTENATGQKVQHTVFPSDENEADGIARIIQANVKAKKRSYRDFAIMVRINALTRGLEQALIRLNIPYTVLKALEYFGRAEIKDVLAYVKLILNPSDQIAFERVVNKPVRGVGEKSQEKVITYAKDQGVSLIQACNQADFIGGIPSKSAQGIANFASIMDTLAQLRQASPPEVIRQVLQVSGYLKMLTDSKDDEDQSRRENVEELITAAAKFAQENPEATISDFVQTASLTSDADGYDEKKDCVSIMTLHTAKGLEFPVVFLPALEHGILPHKRAVDAKNESEIEEERRLFFVGMTRAREELYLSRVNGKRAFRGQELNTIESSFLSELASDVIEVNNLSRPPASSKAVNHYRSGGGPTAHVGFEEAGVAIPVPSKKILTKMADPSEPYPVGSFVRHKDYGTGQVAQLSGFGETKQVTVRFNLHGLKTFRCKHVELEVIMRMDTAS